MALSAAKVTALRFKIAISAVMFPSCGGRALSDFSPFLGGEARSSRLTALLAPELSESHRGGILPRIGLGAILDNLACGKIDDELCELVCVPRTLA
jgi:hypothetical protein